MLTMPCDVRRLVRLRMRAHGDEVVADALARWESEDVGAEELSRARERLPIDARIWLSPWPLTALARTLSFANASARVRSGPYDAPLPVSDAPILLALAQLERVDPVGFALVIERLRGAYEPLVWRAALGETDAALDERLTLALYRLLSLRAGVLLRIADDQARVCLAARHFRAGDPSDIACLRSARAELEDKTLTMSALKLLEQSGARTSLELLAADPTFGVVLSTEVLAAIRVALGLAVGDDLPGSGRDLEPIVACVAREVQAASPRTRDGHPSHADLAWFAALEAPRDKALAHVEHLLCCADGRCVRVLRGEVCGRQSVLNVLADPLEDPPPRSFRGANVAAMAQASPHMIKCRDVLWETFATMASEEGRSVDDLVEEAMDRYRALRTFVRSPSRTDLDPLVAPAAPAPKPVLEKTAPHPTDWTPMVPVVEPTARRDRPLGNRDEPPPSPPPTTRRRSSRPPPASGGKTGLRLGSWPAPAPGAEGSKERGDDPKTPAEVSVEEPTLPNVPNARPTDDPSDPPRKRGR